MQTLSNTLGLSQRAYWSSNWRNAYGRLPDEIHQALRASGIDFRHRSFCSHLRPSGQQYRQVIRDLFTGDVFDSTEHEAQSQVETRETLGRRGGESGGN